MCAERRVESRQSPLLIGGGQEGGIRGGTESTLLTSALGAAAAVALANGEAISQHMLTMKRRLVERLLRKFSVTLTVGDPYVLIHLSRFLQ